MVSYALENSASDLTSACQESLSQSGERIGTSKLLGKGLEKILWDNLRCSRNPFRGSRSTPSRFM